LKYDIFLPTVTLKGQQTKHVLHKSIYWYSKKLMLLLHRHWFVNDSKSK